MKYNFLFILLVFGIISIIFFLIPHRIKKKHKRTGKKIIKKTNTQDYSAEILKDKNNRKNLISNEKPLFQIFNVRITDINGEQKTTFVFNEEILINFDYVLPPGNYVFRLELDKDLEFFQNQDILRSGKSQTDTKPLLLKIKNYIGLNDLQLEKIKILVFQTDNYENPLYVYNHNANLVIQNLKINLIKENNNIIKKNNKKKNDIIGNDNLKNNLELKEDAKHICTEIIKNNPVTELQKHLPILEYCADQGVLQAQEYIELYYKNLEIK